MASKRPVSAAPTGSSIPDSSTPATTVGRPSIASVLPIAAVSTQPLAPERGGDDHNLGRTSGLVGAGQNAPERRADAEHVEQRSAGVNDRRRHRIARTGDVRGKEDKLRHRIERSSVLAPGPKWRSFTSSADPSGSCRQLSRRWTSRSGVRYLSGSSRTPSTIENTAVAAPIVKASVTTTVAE